MDREIPILYNNKSDCCACGACMNICPQKAISMSEDDYGFLYPNIDKKKCVRCGKCKSVCAFQNTKEQNNPKETYAAVARDQKIVAKSASGGVFAGLAMKMIKEGGIVVGAEMLDDFLVKHTVIDKAEDIRKLQGSKYTQSDTGWVFKEVKQFLAEGRKVLFSGTPCQVAGLYGYLGKKYDNLFTVDIICHGVPNNRMLKEYLHLVAQKHGGDITEFTFRDKGIGWGINGSAQIKGKKVKIWQSSSPYFYYFAQGWIYRENCYTCPYACMHRPADITLGDYWGIEKQHPEYLGKDNWDERKGISVVIVNSEKGRRYLEHTDEWIEKKPSSFEKAAAGNGQLRHPSSPGKRREILDFYKIDGWTAIERQFIKKMGWRLYSSQIKALLPGWLKRKLKAKR